MLFRSHPGGWRAIPFRDLDGEIVGSILRARRRHQKSNKNTPNGEYYSTIQQGANLQHFLHSIGRRNGAEGLMPERIGYGQIFDLLSVLHVLSVEAGATCIQGCRDN